MITKVNSWHKMHATFILNSASRSHVTQSNITFKSMILNSTERLSEASSLNRTFFKKHFFLQQWWIRCMFIRWLWCRYYSCKYSALLYLNKWQHCKQNIYFIECTFECASEKAAFLNCFWTFCEQRFVMFTVCCTWTPEIMLLWRCFGYFRRHAINY